MLLTDYIVRHLKMKEGITHAFVYAGGTDAPIIHSIHETKGMQFIPVRHESNASLAAVGYSLVSEKVGWLEARSAASLRRVFEVLRPYGGAACFEVGDADRPSLIATARQADLPGGKVETPGGLVVLRRVGWGVGAVLGVAGGIWFLAGAAGDKGPDAMETLVGLALLTAGVFCVARVFRESRRSV